MLSYLSSLLIFIFILSMNQLLVRCSPTILLFKERVIFPLTYQACDSYSEQAVLASQSTDQDANLYLERHIINQAVNRVMMADKNQSYEIRFTCVDELIYENDSTELLNSSTTYAGIFGRDITFFLNSDTHYTSIPTIHFENVYIQKRITKETSSMNIFEFLSFPFYFAIFLTPILTGVVLLLQKEESVTFYDYQGIVYSVFRYLNRQGDQQMRSWMQKALAYSIAVFFFFHYSILLSEVTAFKTTSINQESLNRDAYRGISNLRNNSLEFSISSSKYLFVDSFQYQFLRDDFELKGELIESKRDHYNLLLSKAYFSQAQVKAIEREILILSKELTMNLPLIEYAPLFEANNEDVFWNWIIVFVAVFIGILLKIAAAHFTTFKEQTEVKAFRKGCNDDVQENTAKMFSVFLNDTLNLVSEKDHTLYFSKHAKITSNHIFMGKQIYRIISKRRKKISKHTLRHKRINNQNQIHSISQTKASPSFPQNNKFNLYSTIKAYIDIEKKAPLTASNTRRMNIMNANNNDNFDNSMHNQSNSGISSNQYDSISPNKNKQHQQFLQNHYITSNFSQLQRKSNAPAPSERMLLQNPKRTLNNLVRRSSSRFETSSDNNCLKPSSLVQSPEHTRILQRERELNLDDVSRTQQRNAVQVMQQQQLPFQRRVGRNLQLNTMSLLSLQQYEVNLNTRAKQVSPVTKLSFLSQAKIAEEAEDFEGKDGQSTASIDEGPLQQMFIPLFKETYNNKGMNDLQCHTQQLYSEKDHDIAHHFSNDLLSENNEPQASNSTQAFVSPSKEQNSIQRNSDAQLTLEPIRIETIE